MDTGDFVIVVNAEKIHVTGQKLDQKSYWRHSGYPGGIRSRTLREQLERRPTEVIRKAVKGMLPKNGLRRARSPSSRSTPARITRTRRRPRRPWRSDHRMAEIAQYIGTGKRKTPVARVILRPGDGTTWFNGRTIEEYFPRAAHRIAELAPLKTAAAEGTTTSACVCTAAGPAARRAPSATASPARSSRPTPSCACRSSARAYLTRDARQVERKKAGLHKARKAPQFSKR